MILASMNTEEAFSPSPPTGTSRTSHSVTCISYLSSWRGPEHRLAKPRKKKIKEMRKGEEEKDDS